MFNNEARLIGRLWENVDHYEARLLGRLWEKVDHEARLIGRLWETAGTVDLTVLPVLAVMLCALMSLLVTGLKRRSLCARERRLLPS